MELAYWQGRWDRNEIGFHEARGSDLLATYARLLDGKKRVLVPLCGKSVDMTLLAQRGHEVVGLEAVRAACRAYFADARVPATILPRGPFTLHRPHDDQALRVTIAE